MILFIFEGKSPEVNFFKSLKKLYWGDEEIVVAVYDCNIDALYHDMIKLGDGADIVEFMMDKYKDHKDNPFKYVPRSDAFSEIYLVFDYDFHDVNRSPEQLNDQLKYLLAYFNEETSNGKLYVNYPMVEAAAYTKKLPDAEFISYTVTRDECRSFKQLTHTFSAYPNFDFLTRGDENDLRWNWDFVRKQNADKAQAMTDLQRPEQEDILQAQISKYECLDGCQVAVLSAFALLIQDWLGK